MSLEAVKNRIKEFESSHKVPGGTHIEGGNCPTCAVIEKLRGLQEQYLNEKLQEAFKKDKARMEELSGISFDNTIEHISVLMQNDNEDTEKQSDQLESLYEIATETQKKAIDNAFICLCGYSLDTIINSPENISDGNYYGPKMHN